MDFRPVPGWLDGHYWKLATARGDETRLRRLFTRSRLPMVLVDDWRRYREVNVSARLTFRRSLAELQQLTIDDLTPDYLHPVMEARWSELVDTGAATGPYEVASPDDNRFEITYFGLARALPGLHLIAFAPTALPDSELLRDAQLERESAAPLTPRELEILELAAEGYNGPGIAAELVLSPATVRTHFEHIYAKLGVRDRASAVATAMRLRLIH